MTEKDNILGAESEHDFSKKTILVVEDEDSNYALLEALLTPAGALLFHAKTASAALGFIKSQQNIDLILMDIKLPDMNGYELTRIIRQENKEVPIIAQTAFAMSDDKIRALESGCNAYFAKPIDLFELMDIIAGFIN
ncbi:MAG: response regulator [Bacteroidetes bacterium]|nr:response regulator [Bacteroidota bacterium]